MVETELLWSLIVLLSVCWSTYSSPLLLGCSFLRIPKWKCGITNSTASPWPPWAQFVSPQGPEYWQNCISASQSLSHHFFFCYALSPKPITNQQIPKREQYSRISHSMAFLHCGIVFSVSPGILEISLRSSNLCSWYFVKLCF